MKRKIEEEETTDKKTKQEKNEKEEFAKDVVHYAQEHPDEKFIINISDFNMDAWKHAVKYVSPSLVTIKYKMVGSTNKHFLDWKFNDRKDFTYNGEKANERFLSHPCDIFDVLKIKPNTDNVTQKTKRDGTIYYESVLETKGCILKLKEHS